MSYRTCPKTFVVTLQLEAQTFETSMSASAYERTLLRDHVVNVTIESIGGQAKSRLSRSPVIWQSLMVNLPLTLVPG